jgi:phenylacetic acid degradation operon negative regulatory protein
MKLDNQLSVRTQFLVFTLFGEYVMLRGGIIWTGDLLKLLNLLGVSERAARSTLSRMTRKGWLSSRKQGRRSRYSMTPRGWMLIKQGEQRIFEQPIKEWNGEWHMVVYSIPERKRRLRHQLRQRLTWYGYGALAPGTWISPHTRSIEIKNMCNELGIQDHVEMFFCSHLGLSTDHELAQECWKIEELQAGYRRFIDCFQNEYHATKMLLESGSPPSPAQCFVSRFWLTNYFQSFPRQDPNLPIVLLPKDWVGFQARELFNNYRKLLEPFANSFVDEVMRIESSLGKTPQRTLWGEGEAREEKQKALSEAG